MATNQRDSNDDLYLKGADLVVVDDYTITAVDDAEIHINGPTHINGLLVIPPLNAAFVHTQGSPATTWTVNHNLGYRPTVQIYNASNFEVEAEIESPTTNQVIVRFSTATAGFARCY